MLVVVRVDSGVLNECEPADFPDLDLDDQLVMRWHDSEARGRTARFVPRFFGATIIVLPEIENSGFTYPERRENRRCHVDAVSSFRPPAAHYAAELDYA